jgi:hypothetical protein
MNALGTPRTMPSRFEIIILLIRVNAYFQYGKKVFRMLYSSTLLFMYYNVFIRRSITRSAKREKYIWLWQGIAITYTVDIWKTQRRIYYILKLRMLLKSSVFWDITQCSSVKLNRRLGDTYRLHLHERRVSQTWNRLCRHESVQANSSLVHLFPSLMEHKFLF